jgi:HK97 gp10 family phage protein
MRLGVKLEGMADLNRRLAQLPATVNRRVQIDALKAGAEVIRREAATLAPRDERAKPPHLADSIVIAVATGQDEVGEKQTAVEVGPSRKPSDHFYGFFQEFGTVRHRAQPFMRPAFDTQSGRALNIVLSTLWNAIKKALPNTVSRTGGGTGL